MSRLHAFRRRAPRLFGLLVGLLVLTVVSAVAMTVWGTRIGRQVSALNGQLTATDQQQKAQLMSLQQDRLMLAGQLDEMETKLASTKADGTHLAIDLSDSTLYLEFNDKTLRAVKLRLGADTTVQVPGGERYTFIVPRGPFVVEKVGRNVEWQVPDWLYTLHGKAVPDVRPRITGGLGRYVLFLGENIVIHSPPVESSPLTQPYPGSFEAPEADLKALFETVKVGTKVFIYSDPSKAPHSVGTTGERRDHS